MARPKKEAPNRADGLYEIKVTVGRDILTGKAIRKSFYSSVSKADAKAKADAYIREQELMSYGIIQKSTDNILFKDWADKWLTIYKKPYVSENTYRITYEHSVEKHIKPYFKNAKLNDIRPIDIQKLFALKKSLSESMLDKINMCLISIFDTAIDNDLIVKNPAKNISYKSDKQKNKKNVYSSDEIKIAKQYFSNKFPEVIILLCTGMRRGELVGLKWSDINFEKKSIKIDRSIADKKGGGVIIRPPKWNSNREIPLEKEAEVALLAISRNSEYVFPNSFNAPQSPNTLSQKLERYMIQFNKDTGLQKLTAHELRHTYGTELRRRGVDIYTIQKIMGHRDIKMTSELYVHNEFEELKKAILSNSKDNDKNKTNNS